MASTTPRRFLPSDPRVEEPYRLTPQLALRVAILGFLALAIFAVLFLRLWALQVLAGNKYRAQANDNRVRTLQIDALRGPILDRNGRPLVTNVSGTRVELWPADMPKGRTAQRTEVVRLATVTGVPAAEIRRKIKQNAGDPLTPIVVQSGLHADRIAYIDEHQLEFPGVQLADTYLRKYPYQSLAAHILGYVGPITQAEYRARKKQGYQPTDSLGQSGIEAAYDAYLRGRDGTAQLTVDSRGRPTSSLQLDVLPRPGNALRLTIDVDLQQAAEKALRDGIALAHASGAWAADGGAIVALDPRDGSDARARLEPDLQAVGLRRPPRPGQARAAPEPEAGRGGQLPRPRPRDRRRVPAGLDVEAGDRARGDAGAHPLAVHAAPLLADVRRQGRDGREPDLPQLDPVRRSVDGPEDRARRVVRHLLLPSGLQLLQAAADPRPPAPGVGLAVRIRVDDRARHRRRGARARADARVAAGGVRRAEVHRPSTARGSPATRSSSRSGRATCS